MPLHYSDAGLARYMMGLSEERGENIRVCRADGRAWMVQRHYIALHGLRSEDLGTPKIPPFTEITE